MKAEEKKAARKLRKAGYSVRAIAQETGCAKSSVSTWVRDISLTTAQIAQLKSNQDRARAKAAQHINAPKQKWARIRDEIVNRSSQEIPSRYSSTDLKILGAALYWAEGYNASRNVFVFTNSNAGMIKVMMRFLREICQVPKEKIKGRVNIHPHLNIEKAEKYWMNIAKIPKSNFNKPVLSVSKASKQKRDSLPLGTFNIIVCDVRLVSRIKGWIEGLLNWGE
ncbi:MAG: hypothetical protein V2A72_01555 [Candidatus Omnitrophota bacterium]